MKAQTRGKRAPDQDPETNLPHVHETRLRRSWENKISDHHPNQNIGKNRKQENPPQKRFHKHPNNFLHEQITGNKREILNPFVRYKLGRHFPT